MPPIRVLVVDDAVVVRRMVANVLAKDPDIDVVGVAANGSIALAKLPIVNPDVVTLDVEMPGMDGLETLAKIRETHKTLPVIMFSTLTERGAAATLDALALGANDYVAKPANVGSVTVAIQRIRENLIPRIKVWGRRQPSYVSAPAAPLKPETVSRSPAPAQQNRIAAVTIGVSTGGPNVLSNLIPELPADFPVPVVIVQHMPPVFTKLFADRLNAISKVTVHEGKDGDTLDAGGVWLAAGGVHTTVERRVLDTVLRTNTDPPENSCRPAVDQLFRSAARRWGQEVLAVVLTGMGRDGTNGSQCIREAGGTVLAQDEATSVVWGMPGEVVKAGLANGGVYPLGELAGEIQRRVDRCLSLSLVRSHSRRSSADASGT